MIWSSDIQGESKDKTPDLNIKVGDEKNWQLT